MSEYEAMLLNRKLAFCSILAAAGTALVFAQDETTFESGFGNWVVENGTWIISSWKEISKNFSALPDPPNFDNKTTATNVRYYTNDNQW